MAWKFAGKFDSERVEDESGRVVGRFSGHSHHVSVTLEYGGTTFKYPPREDSVCTIEEAEAFVRGVEAAQTTETTILTSTG